MDVANDYSPCSNHLTEQELRRYNLGAANIDELAAIEEHFTTCITCLARSESIEEHINGMRAGMVQGGRIVTWHGPERRKQRNRAQLAIVADRTQLRNTA